jgi:hypothetical protein
MGQSHAKPSKPTPVLSKGEALYLSLFKTLSPLCVEDFKATFSTFAETDGSTRPFWKEDAFTKFLDVPARIGSLLFRSASYLAALPNLEGVPALLTLEGLGIAVMVYTQQIPKEVLTTREWTRLLFNSFSEVPNRQGSYLPTDGSGEKNPGSTKSTYGPQISLSTMNDLVLFLLANATTNSIDSSEIKPPADTPSNRRASVAVANSILSALQSYTKSPTEGISYDAFRSFFERDAPYFFDALVPLFQKFLYDSKKWGGDIDRINLVGSLMAERLTMCMTTSTLAQISMFLPKERRLGRLVGLYVGSTDGFSMGMFENKVLKYPGISLMRAISNARAFDIAGERHHRKSVFIQRERSQRSFARSVHFYALEIICKRSLLLGINSNNRKLWRQFVNIIPTSSNSLCLLFRSLSYSARVLPSPHWPWFRLVAPFSATSLVDDIKHDHIPYVGSAGFFVHRFGT